MKTKYVIILLLSIIISNGVKAERVSYYAVETTNLLKEVELNYSNHFIVEEDKYQLTRIKLLPPYINYSKNIKGIYINGWVANNKNKINNLIDGIKKSKLNAVVIDLKDAAGRVTFKKTELNSSSLIIKNLKGLIDRFHRQGIYVIGRLTLFKDPILAQKEDYALQYSVDNKKELVSSDQWTNPYSKKVWKYNLELAQQASELGLDEIQFDYVRFPTLSKNSTLAIKGNGKDSKADIIVQFLQYAQKSLQDYNILISADVFGLTTTVKGDLAIGQDITRMIKYVDYISPMIYPSHYSAGMYGVADPDSNPYKIITSSLKDAREKLGKDSYKLRPWLQDFSLFNTYDEQEIRDQIEAVNNNKLSGWLLWNPSSIYTIDAVMLEDKKG